MGVPTADKLDKLVIFICFIFTSSQALRKANNCCTIFAYVSNAEGEDLNN